MCPAIATSGTSSVRIFTAEQAETANGGGTSNEAFEDTNESIEDKEDDVDNDLKLLRNSDEVKNDPLG